MANKHPNTSGLRRGRAEKYGNLCDDLGNMRWVMNHPPERDTTDAQRRWRKLMDDDFLEFAKIKRAYEADRARYLNKLRLRKAKAAADEPEEDDDDLDAARERLRAIAATTGEATSDDEAPNSFAQLMKAHGFDPEKIRADNERRSDEARALAERVRASCKPKT